MHECPKREYSHYRFFEKRLSIWFEKYQSDFSPQHELSLQDFEV
jgi:hypothetical protein